MIFIIRIKLRLFDVSIFQQANLLDSFLNGIAIFGGGGGDLFWKY